jgi:hypothetical protein
LYWAFSQFKRKPRFGYAMMMATDGWQPTIKIFSSRPEQNNLAGTARFTSGACSFSLPYDSTSNSAFAVMRFLFVCKEMGAF